MTAHPQFKTPQALGFRMPAEWEPHEATWLGWPHELTDWPGKFAPIPWAFAEIVRHLSRVERVYLLVENRESESRVRSILKKSGANLDAVDFFRVPTDRGWMRDSGPICVRTTPAKSPTTISCSTAGPSIRITEKRRRRRQSKQQIKAPPLAAGSQSPPRRSRRRQHRRERPRNASNHGRMPAKAKRRREISASPNKTTADVFREYFGVHQCTLAEKWHCRRRHPRPRRRPDALRESLNGRDFLQGCSSDPAGSPSMMVTTVEGFTKRVRSSTWPWVSSPAMPFFSQSTLVTPKVFAEDVRVVLFGEPRFSPALCFAGILPWLEAFRGRSRRCCRLRERRGGLCEPAARGGALICCLLWRRRRRLFCDSNTWPSRLNMKLL